MVQNDNKIVVSKNFTFEMYQVTNDYQVKQKRKWKPTCIYYKHTCRVLSSTTHSQIYHKQKNKHSNTVNN
jgi:hypothetical protein